MNLLLIPALAALAVLLMLLWLEPVMRVRRELRRPSHQGKGFDATPIERALRNVRRDFVGAVKRRQPHRGYRARSLVNCRHRMCGRRFLQERMESTPVQMDEQAQK